MSTDNLAGSAPAPAETPVDVSLPNPISVSNEATAVEQQRQADETKEAERLAAEKTAKPKPDEKPETKKPLATRDALKKAAEALEAKEKAEAKPDEKPTEKPADKTRDETGKFKGKESELEAETKPKPVEAPKVKLPHDDAPKRLDDAAKKEWANAPEPVRGAVHRTITELEQGIAEHQQYREKLKPYDDLAKQQGTTIHEAMDRYIAFERSLNTNLAEGLEGVIRDVTGGKMGLRDVAARVLGQTPDAARSESDATVADLRKEIGGLKQQLQGFGSHIQQQAETKTADEITGFWKDNPDAEDLAEQMVPHLKAGKSLREAYDLAKSNVEELAAKFGFVRTPAPAQTRNEQIPNPAEAQTLDKGSKSISGAPSAGSVPATKKASSSIRDALNKAIQAASA